MARIVAALVAVGAMAPFWYAGVVGLLAILVATDGSPPDAAEPWSGEAGGVAFGLALWVAAAGILYVQWVLGMFAVTGALPSRRRVAIGAAAILYCLALTAFFVAAG